MAKFYGLIGYSDEQIEDPAGSGIWKDVIIERDAVGDILNQSAQVRTKEINSDISLSQRVSLLGDAYAYEHFHRIRYVKYLGVYWQVTTVEVKHPRLVLSLGEVYNGPTTE